MSIDKKLKDAGMLNANGKHTPFPNNTEYHTTTSDDIELPDTVEKFWKLVGDLPYIADSTRPDIVYVVGRLGTAMSKPTVRHWNIMKEVLRSIEKTRNFG